MENKTNDKDQDQEQKDESFAYDLKRKTLNVDDVRWKECYQQLWRNFAKNKEEQDIKISKILSLPQDQIKLNNNQDLQVYGIHCLLKKIKKHDECEFIIKMIKGQKAFEKQQELLGKIKPKIINEALKLEFYKKNETIFDFGDYGFHYYIILKGSTFCLLPNNESPETLQQIQRTVAFPSPQKPKLKKTKTDKVVADVVDDTQEFLKQNFPNFHPIEMFQAGSGFGEIALISSGRRMATIVCAEDTFLMSMSKKAYNELIGAYLIQQKQEKINFLHKFYFFQNIYEGVLLSLIIEMKLNNFQYNHIIYDEGDEVDNIYFIKLGEVQLSKQDNVNVSPNIIGKLTKKTNQKNKLIGITIQREQTYFGEFEIAKKQNNREMRSTVISQHSEILSLDKQKFMSVLKRGQNSDQVLQDIIQKYQWKLQSHKQNVETSSQQIRVMNNLAKFISQPKIPSSYKNESKILTQVQPIQQKTTKTEINLINKYSFQQFIHPIIQLDKKSHIRNATLNKLNPHNNDLNYIDSGLHSQLQQEINKLNSLKIQKLRKHKSLDTIFSSKKNDQLYDKLGSQLVYQALGQNQVNKVDNSIVIYPLESNNTKMISFLNSENDERGKKFQIKFSLQNSPRQNYNFYSTNQNKNVGKKQLPEIYYSKQSYKKLQSIDGQINRSRNPSKFVHISRKISKLQLPDNDYFTGKTFTQEIFQ